MKGLRQQSPIKQAIFRYAMKIARQRNHCKEYGQPVSIFLEWKYQVCDRIIFQKIREKLGGNLQ
jgi:long-subunit acyl-CoA synthetase (AMP-forming)